MIVFEHDTSMESKNELKGSQAKADIFLAPKEPQTQVQF